MGPSFARLFAAFGFLSLSRLSRPNLVALIVTPHGFRQRDAQEHHDDGERQGADDVDEVTDSAVRTKRSDQCPKDKRDHGTL